MGVLNRFGCQDPAKIYMCFYRRMPVSKPYSKGSLPSKIDAALKQPPF